MEKWQLAGIFSAEPRIKLDLTQIGNLPKTLRSGNREQPSLSTTLWLKATCRKLAKTITFL